MGRHTALTGAEPTTQSTERPPETRLKHYSRERLNTLFEEGCDRLRAEGRSFHLAVDAPGLTLTYDQLDERANQLARHLLDRGARPGQRIALLFDQPWRAYVAMLAVLKIQAAYVPLDPGFPMDRLAYIAADADVAMVLTLSHLRGLTADVAAPAVCVDEEAELIEVQDSSRLPDLDEYGEGSDLAYIIYTSGSTGRPKGVAIEHASICNFVRVAADVYGIQTSDRVYQGMTIAFDFSVEEIWVPWMAGATLVPKPAGSTLLGVELAEFLRRQRITALCCVPTLLATIDEDIPGLRFLLVSGEACPRDLIARWHKPGRRFLNVYGPTEATVTATWAVADPERPVTLGVPLPTYSAVILDPDKSRVLPAGETGEIALAGIGLARGYVNRQDLTDRAFIPDFLNIRNNPSGRIYRTGDLGRFNEDGQIEYYGRIDTQVKIRGYRIELSEIESVLLQVPGVALAVVNTHEPAPGMVELAAYYTLRADTASIDEAGLRAALRERLPAYMVPAYLERLDHIPMMPSGKVDRKKLPAPSAPRNTGGTEDYAAPAEGTEEVLAAALAEVLRVERVSARAHFFDDLGANSLLLAHFSARLRKNGKLPPVAMRDIYLNPTIESLAVALDGEQAAGISDSPYSDRPFRAASTRQYFLCGVLQGVLFLSATLAASFVLLLGYRFASAGGDPVDVLWRSAVFGFVSFVVVCLLPIAAKWLLIGRWKEQEIPVWSLAYLRFWVVKALIRGNPMRMFVGTPVYPLYLRALGAKIGRHVAIFSAMVPVCTDLLTIGDGTVIRKDCAFNCYRAYRGVIQTGPVTIGSDVTVGEAAMIEIGSSIGDGGQLGHASALYASQSIPAGQRWHGSPAQPTGTDYRAVEPAPLSNRRRITYSILVVLNRTVLIAPVGLAGLSLLIPPYLDSDHLDHTKAAFYLDALAISGVLFFGGVLLGLLAVVTIPRLLNLALKPEKVYPLYGLHYVLRGMIAGMTNLRFFMELTGDSSLIVHYLRLLGYKQPGLVQTGSNFGVALKHETPFAATIGSGTMVADGLSIVNADFSSTSFKISPTSVGARSFFGNNIIYPSAGRTGDNCLLATKVMVPVDGPLREGIGLLGSPPFEIPRSVERDSEFKAIGSGSDLPALLKAKNLHNGVTIAFFLLSRWFLTFVALVVASFAVALHTFYDVLAITAGFVFMLLFSAAYFIVIERATLGFGRLNPLFCSIYDGRFWRHERFWKLSATGFLDFFNGTPFKNVIWRLLGVRMGRRVFDDGCAIPEKTIVSIGDDCTLNVLSTIQCHSMEDGAFKVDGITIGARSTIGVNGFVHYGTTLGDDTVLEADSFLMKGEELPQASRFGGNPARELAGKPVRSAV